MPKPLPSRLRRAFKKGGFYTFLAGYLHKKYRTWADRYDNVVGVNITKKIREHKIVNRYAVVFYVVRKTDDTAPKRRIPKYIVVRYKKKRYKVLTDVIETGLHQLTYIQPGQNGFERNRFPDAGSLGPIVLKNGLLHVLSNMHVFGTRFLENNRRIVNQTGTIGPIDVNCQVNDLRRPVGIFQMGIVDNRIDAAIALIPDRLRQFVRRLENVFDTSEPLVFPERIVTRPFPLQMIGHISRLRQSDIISAVGVASFPYPFGLQTLNKLIVLSPCINQPGDSGSVVFEPRSKRIVGIVLGRDLNRQFTYVIPYQTIRVLLGID